MTGLHLPDTRQTRYIFSGLAILITLTMYWGMTGHLFDADDMEYLKDTQRVWEEPARFFSAQRAFPGRPIVEMVFLLVYPIFGENPAAYHLLLIGLHIFVGLFLGHVLRQLGVRFDLSLLASFLFLINITHFRAVHWIACLSYPIALIFGLAALLSFERHLQTHQRSSLIWSLFYIALAVCAHVGISTVTIFAVYRAWQHHKRSLRNAFLSASPLILLSGILSVAIYLLFPKASQVLAVVHEPSVIRTITLFFWFLSRLITAAHWWPAGLTGEPHNWEIVIGVLTALLLFIALIKNNAPTAHWSVWTFITILPFINNPHLIMFGPSRYLYFASVGSSLLLAWIILFVFSKFKPQMAQIGLIGTLLLLSTSSILAAKRVEALSLYHAGRSYLGKMIEQTGVELMERALQKDPNIANIVPSDIYIRLGVTLFGLGRSPQSYLEQAQQQNPDDPQIKVLLAVSYMDTQNPTLQQQGENLLQQTLTQNPDAQLKLMAARSFGNIGKAAIRTGNYLSAVPALYRAKTYWPNDPLTRLMLGHALFMQETDPITTFSDTNQGYLTQHHQGASTQIIQSLNSTLKPNPQNSEGYETLGLIQLETEEFTSALSSFELASRFKPQSTLAIHGRAQVLQMLGQHREAFQAHQQLIGLAPQNPAVYYNLGQLFDAIGETTQAQLYFNQAKKLKPNLFQ